MTTTRTSARCLGAAFLAVGLVTGCAGGADDEAVEEARALASQAAEDRAAAESAAAAASAAAAEVDGKTEDVEDSSPEQGSTPVPEMQETRTPLDQDDADGGVVLEFVMPNLRGADLQSAQDAVQELGVFFSTSTDLRGSRLQVLDSNWIVCSSDPAPGTTVRGEEGELEGSIDFGVVKRDESCP